ncbi:MAG: hypothetical protein SVZ03_16955 [Spirochaetota bacterium]|nr:hypothetical protein [Spirochaetota bacterium]
MDTNKKGVIKDQASIIDIEEDVLNKEVEDSLFYQIISLGIKSYTELIEEEITEICGKNIYTYNRQRIYEMEYD